jgi:hypothetical protein
MPGNWPAPGCQSDVDCKGERICERHRCVFPGTGAAAVQGASSSVPQAAMPTAAALASQPSEKLTPASCAPLVPAVAFGGTEVRSGPEPSTPVLVTLKHDTPLCAAERAQGFYFRRVKLADGTEGFVKRVDFSQ